MSSSYYNLGGGDGDGDGGDDDVICLSAAIAPREGAATPTARVPSTSKCEPPPPPPPPPPSSQMLSFGRLF